MKKSVQRYMADKGTLMNIATEDALIEGGSFIEVVPAADYDALRAELEDLKKSIPTVIKGSVGGGDVTSNTVYVALDQQAPWPDLSIGTPVALLAGAGEKVEILPKDHVAIPLTPPKALLISMAIRSDHALAVPGYYDQAMFAEQGASHAQHFEAELVRMGQLYEEVTMCLGFYSCSNPQRYLDIADQTAALDQQ